ncbi:PIN domain-containing protein [Candidatus Parcubacteria bacterium]|nr:MAG: PIN domain-containing protein [Candidatus Parcubacteria bacterium]
MPRQVFVDATAWIATADNSEARHGDAVKVYSQLLRDGSLLVATSLVIAEAHILLRRRLGYRAAMRFLNSVNESPRIEIVHPDPHLEAAAKQILRQYDDQDFSLADAFSFALMRERGITEAFAFDQHFVTAGFVLIPPS